MLWLHSRATFCDFRIGSVFLFQIASVSFLTLDNALSQTRTLPPTKANPTILGVRNRTPSTFFKCTHEPSLTICQTLFENEQFSLTIRISLTTTPSNQFVHFIYAYKKYVLHNTDFSKSTSCRHNFSLHNNKQYNFIFPFLQRYKCFTLIQFT